jgi:cold shock CspA family protein
METFVGVIQVEGRIKILDRGHGCGTISLPTATVFFHKSEVEGTFWDLRVGDRVVFELLDDAISGPRARRVRAQRARPGR